MKRNRAANYVAHNQQLQIEGGPVREESNNTLKRRGRGSSNRREPTSVVTDRPLVWPVGKKEFDSVPYCGKIPTTICKLALENFDGPWNSFHEFDATVKLLVMEQFLTCYGWRCLNVAECPETPEQCREVMERIAAKGFKETLRRCRIDCKKNFDLDVDKWKKHVPVWCKNAEHWEKLCDLWCSEEYQKGCDQARQNRCNSGQIAKHCGGSMSVYQHEKKWQKDNNTTDKPKKIDLYIQLHVKKKNKKICHGNHVSQENDAAADLEGGGEDTSSDLEFFDDAQQQIFERVKELQEDPEYKDKPEETLLMIASREANKCRTYGLGSLLDNCEMSTTTNRRVRPSNYSSFSATPASTVYTKEEVEKLLEEREHKYAEERAKEREEQERKEAERDARNQVLFGQIFATLNHTMPMLNMSAFNMPNFDMPTNIMQHRSLAIPPMGNNTSQGPTHEEGEEDEEGLSAASTSNAMGEFTALLTNHSRKQVQHDYVPAYENLS